jgi:hypothetical protein
MHVYLDDRRHVVSVKAKGWLTLCGKFIDKGLDPSPEDLGWPECFQCELRAKRNNQSLAANP